MQETWVQSLDWEDPLEEGMETHSSIVAWGMLWYFYRNWQVTILAIRNLHWPQKLVILKTVQMIYAWGLCTAQKYRFVSLSLKMKI